MPLDEVREPAPRPQDRELQDPAPPDWEPQKREQDLEPPGDAELDQVVERVVREEKALLEKHGRGPNLAGLALSGGGVRSATLSLGFLLELSRHGVIEQVDYLSSVSGGGYASGYFYGSIATMSAEARRSPKARHCELFGWKAVEKLRAAGHYLNLGTGFKGRFHLIRLVAATLNAAIINALWLVVLFATGASLAAWACILGLGASAEARLWEALLYVLTLMPLARLLLLWWQGTGRVAFLTSSLVNRVEGGMLIAGAVVLLAALWLKLQPIVDPWIAGPVEQVIDELFGVSLLGVVGARGEVALACLLVSVLLCFLVTPSAIGLHGVFRERIEAAYFTAKPHRRWRPAIMLHELKERLADGVPYPLFNGCVYLRDDTDKYFPGSQAVDYFLLSPGQCGSRLTGYASTRDVYPGMSVAEAVTTSAASITPSMDGTSNGIASAVLWGLNLNLGAWLQNPGVPKRRLPVAWTLQYLRVLRGKLSRRARLVHVADGGFIDNLGVFELLRRRCGFIIAVDNTYDPHYEFKHLRTLVARARSELGVTLTFRQQPEVLRPSAGLGFAGAPLVVADIETLDGVKTPWHGVLVYVKACLLAPDTFNRQQQAQSYRYKTGHPKFPQESTADQFFDPAQWEAYFTLGRHMACEVLGTERSTSHGRAAQRLELTALRARFESQAARAAACR